MITHMVILLVGASGLLGTALRDSLPERHVRQLVRRDPRPDDAVDTVTWDARTPPPSKVFDGVTAVINLGGAGVGDRRWSNERLRVIESSRTGPTRALATAIANLPNKVRYLQANAVGYYGDTGNTPTDEHGTRGSTILADICTAWQDAATPAVVAGHPTTFLRTGIVLSPDGGALGPMLKLIKLGLGGPMGSGKQWWPWIHIDDWVGAVRFLLDNEVTGPVNLTSPHPETNKDLTKVVASAFNRPSLMPAPAFALRLALGGFANEILQSQRVIPQKLLDAGFEFTYPDVADAAQALTRSTRHSS